MAYIRKLKSGKYQVNIRQVGLKPITKTFPTKRLATQFQREAEGNTSILIALGKPLPETITFQKYLDIYIEQYTGKDPSTIGRLNHWCKLFGDKPLLSITDDMVDTGLIELYERVSSQQSIDIKAPCQPYLSTLIDPPIIKDINSLTLLEASLFLAILKIQPKKDIYL